MSEPRRLTSRRLFWALTGAVLLWTLFTAGQGWDPLGLLVVTAATLAGAWWTPLWLRPVRWHALPGFGLYFVDRSVRGGVDVAWRALQPTMPLQPQWRVRPLRLPAGGPRSLLVSVISLMPGTLCAELVDDELVVHALAQGLDGELDELERRIARLYALE
ncbi:Na+/H+ antiporter subunit E [Alkalilimnicola ehrlichii MLHE-1]|nr:Na+/H+ antiporter subunit E [Alkalilimnicola ehrlichii]